MPRSFGRDMMHRWEGNPIITIEDMPFQCSDICNAGAVKLGNRYLLLLTVEGLAGRKAIYPAWSGDGLHFTVGGEPFLSRSREGEYAIYEEQGVLDPRVVPVNGEYFLTYHAISAHGYVMALARTKDFTSVERLGLITEPDCKSGAIFPRKIKGRYARLERPTEGGNMWVAYSDDLTYWGGQEVVVSPRGGFWDDHHIGPCAPPILITEGWLCIYYGVKMTSAGPLYRMGALILDANEPTAVLGRTNVPILAPRESYERLGDLPNIIFSTGAILEDDNTLNLYYGGSDSCICLATAPLKSIVDGCLEPETEF